MTVDVSYEWRGVISDIELVTLTDSYGGNSAPGWWDRIRPFSLGWVAARLPNSEAAGFVNVAWDGGDHAFLIDTKVRADLQHNGIGTELVRVATLEAKRAGCEWLHVDYAARLASFYEDALRVHEDCREPDPPSGLSRRLNHLPPALNPRRATVRSGWSRGGPATRPR